MLFCQGDNCASIMGCVLFIYSSFSVDDEHIFGTLLMLLFSGNVEFLYDCVYLLTICFNIGIVFCSQFLSEMCTFLQLFLSPECLIAHCPVPGECFIVHCLVPCEWWIVHCPVPGECFIVYCLVPCEWWIVHCVVACECFIVHCHIPCECFIVLCQVHLPVVWMFSYTQLCECTCSLVFAVSLSRLLVHCVLATAPGGPDVS